MNVVLIGFSCTGKSSVGRALAERLGWEFVDTDEEVVRTAGRPIDRIFAEDGENVFRLLEQETVARALHGERVVVAVGGGAVMNSASRRAMRDGNLVVLLDAEVETLLGRLTAADTARPLLEATDLRARIEELKLARDTVYREAAHVRVATDGDDVAGVARKVAEAARAYIRITVVPEEEKP